MHACMQAEAVLRMFNDRKLDKSNRDLFEKALDRLADLAYECMIFVDSKWHLIACRYNFPMHLTMFNTVLDCMEQVSCSEIH